MEEIRTPSRSRGFGAWPTCAGLFAVVFGLLVSPPVSAGTLAGGSGICKLPRSPWVHHEAAPENLECLIDEDDDGIDDEIEALLANCFAPSFHFAATEDTRVTGDAKFPGNQEPFTAFNVFPHVANASGTPQGCAVIHNAQIDARASARATR
jgi:hypothetical protein